MRLAPRLTLPAIGLAALAALAGCASPGAASSPTPTREAEPPLLHALHMCNLVPTSDGVDYADGGKTLILSTTGNDTATLLDFASVKCVLQEVDASAATLNAIEETRALDGRQDKAWTGIDASWSYHPDDGLNLSLEDTSKG